MAKMQRIAFNLSDSDLHKLCVLASHNGVPVGEELHIAIDAHLKKNAEKLGPTLVKSDKKLEDFIRASTEPRRAEVVNIKK